MFHCLVIYISTIPPMKSGDPGEESRENLTCHKTEKAHLLSCNHD